MKKIFGMVACGALCLASLASCKFSFGGTTSVTYLNSSSYETGKADLDGGVNELEVNWITGSVKLSKSEDDKIHISESCEKSLDDNLQVHYLFKDNKLTIQPSATGYYNFSDYKKSLDVSVPATVLEKLDVNIVSASANIMVDSLNYEIDTVSGDLTLTTSVNTNMVKINSVSGKGVVNVSTFNQIDLNSVSGSFEINTKCNSSVNFNSVSGELDNTLEDDSTRKITCSTVSGSLKTKQS